MSEPGDVADYVLSTDRRTLVVTHRTPAGILTTTFNRAARAGPFTDTDVAYAIRSLLASSRTMEPGQRNRSRRFVTRFGTLYAHVMTGPPAWWLPRVLRGKDGALTAGWLRLAVAVKFDPAGRAHGRAGTAGGGHG
jgi:hypothetical protein